MTTPVKVHTLHASCDVHLLHPPSAPPSHVPMPLPSPPSVSLPLPPSPPTECKGAEQTVSCQGLMGQTTSSPVGRSAESKRAGTGTVGHQFHLLLVLHFTTGSLWPCPSDQAHTLQTASPLPYARDAFPGATLGDRRAGDLGDPDVVRCGVPSITTIMQGSLKLNAVDRVFSGRRWLRAF